MNTKDIQNTAIEVLKTAGGAVAGRIVVVQAKKMLKVSEETDPKKKKIKEVAIGGGVAAIGTVAAIKLPKEYKSFMGGIATAGVFAAVTPFGKDDKGFIPVLRGTEGEEVIYSEDALNALGAMSQEELDYIEMLNEEEENENTISALEGEYEDFEGYEEVPSTDFSNLNGQISALN
ncbi:hypothetical protein L3073_06050 [Ancylomarina sp. DW003]|nr:hypothetical protein [Ancylomarina sp. DW003]MDE5421763.1 hypothetical protein [Ancylomarina sp. DW003]